MDISKVGMNIVRYRLDACSISTPKLKEPYVVPHSAILGMVLDHDYEKFFMPYFQMEFNLPSMVVRAMKKSPNDIKITLQMSALYFDKNDYQTLVATSTSKQIKGTFVAYMEKPSRSILDSAMEEYEENVGYSAKNVDPNSMSSVKVSLYEEKTLNKMGTKANYIVSAACLVDILTLVLNTAGITNVLLSPPNNYKTYKEFKVTPISASKQLERICNKYGLHTNGSLVFFGLDRNYIIDKVPKCTAYSTNEYQTTYLYYPGVGGESMALSSGCGKSATEKANYILLTPSLVRFNDLSVAAGEAYSENTVAIDPINGVLSNSKDPDYNIKTEGDNTAGILNRFTKSFGLVADITLHNIDLEMLTPNKCFNITVDDMRYKEYNANYMITKATTTFIKQGDIFDTITLCNFRT